MKNFLEVIKLILSSTGINILEPSKRTKEDKEQVKDKIFEFRIKGALGKMKLEEDKYIVLKGSTAVIGERPSASESIVKMRKNLINKDIMKKLENSLYIFQEDYIFNSPSYAAAAISAGNENGRRQWKYNGRNLNEIEEDEINTIDS